LSRYDDEPDFIYRIVTQDETWVQYPKIKTEHAVEAPWLTPPKKLKRLPSAGKMMASVFGIVRR
jgi:hypothetical protein